MTKPIKSLQGSKKMVKDGKVVDKGFYGHQVNSPSDPGQAFGPAPNPEAERMRKQTKKSMATGKSGTKKAPK